MYIYILLALFFASLVAIIIMVGRKVATLEHEQIAHHEEVLFEIPHLEKVKRLTVTNLRKYGHAGLVETVRFYLRSMNFLKNKYQEVKTKIKERSEKKQTDGQNKKISEFLKIIGNYKHKIREIKHKIKKEENL